MNGAGALIATGFAAAGLARPSIANPDADVQPDGIAQFWAASSAIRTWAVAGPLLAALLARRDPSPQIVTAAGLVQLGDAVLGFRQRNIFMAVAPAIMGVVHLVTARQLSLNSRRSPTQTMNGSTPTPATRGLKGSGPRRASDGPGCFS